MPLEKFIPLSPDPYITQDSDMKLAQFGHLNTIVDYLNGTNALTDIKIAGDNNTPGYIDFSANPIGSTTIVGAIRTYQDGTNLLPTLQFVESGDIYQNKYTGIINNYFFQDNAGVNMTNGTGVYQGDYVGRRNGATSTLFREAVTYNGDGTTRRGRYSMGVAESSGFGAYQLVLTQYGNVKVNISGNNAGSYIDDAISPTTAYNIHAGNIINTTGSTLPLLSLDVNGLTKHVFQTNGNVSFNNTADMAAIVGIKGSGSTSATTSLLVQNSAGTQLLKVSDDGVMNFGNANTTGDYTFVGSNIVVLKLNDTLNSKTLAFYKNAGSNYIADTNSDTRLSYGWGGNYFWRLNGLTKSMAISSTTSDPDANASAIVDFQSTTKGFLKPKMTTAQKNLIVTPTAGLEVYDTDLNRPCFYSGSAWVTL